MRVPPPHRKSLTLQIPLFLIKLKRKIQCNNWKKRKRIHKLHRIHRRRISNNLEIPEFDLRVEDSYSMKTEYLSTNITDKPLLIATFDNDCTKFPQINILERSKLSRLHLKKRKFKLKILDYNPINISNKLDNANQQFRCVSTIRSIKNLVDDDADVRPIFHNKNIIRCSQLKGLRNDESDTSNNLSQKKYIKFVNNGIVDINSLPSLRTTEDLNVTTKGHLNIQKFNQQTQNCFASDTKIEKLSFINNKKHTGSYFKHDKKHKLIKIVYHSKFICQDN